jgi:hypothetical protein
VFWIFFVQGLIAFRYLIGFFNIFAKHNTEWETHNHENNRYWWNRGAANCIEMPYLRIGTYHIEDGLRFVTFNWKVTKKIILIILPAQVNTKSI